MNSARRLLIVVRWGAIMPLLLTLCGCLRYDRLTLGSPHERIHPDIPNITLHFRYLSRVTKEEVRPQLVQVVLSRWYGRVRTAEYGSVGIQTILKSSLAEGNMAELPHYVPDPSENEELYRYSFWVCLYMNDRLETISYEIARSSLSGESSPDGRWVFPWGPDGNVQIDVPFSGDKRDFSVVRDRGCLQNELEELAADKTGSQKALSKEERDKVADWALARLDDLAANNTDPAVIQRIRDRWKAIKGEGAK